jgi:hypothetical protein
MGINLVEYSYILKDWLFQVHSWKLSNDMVKGFKINFYINIKI